MDLDINVVRSHFPAFGSGQGTPAFFENAGGSFACQQTIDALTRFYTETKVQPYSTYLQSATGGQLMDASHVRWAEALGVGPDDVSFGPSTSQNTYVLAEAFAAVLGPGDEVIVTNQDHEANTGAIRRMASRVGATLREWRIDPGSGLLDTNVLASMLSERTKLVTFPHCSNIVGQENDVSAITAMAHAVGARVICDGVSFAPHGLPNVGAMGPDVYLFSLYKTYSVHQGLMVTQNGVMDELPNQSHYFNAGDRRKKLVPAGPDHAQVAAAGAVLDYVETLHQVHGGDGGLAAAARSVSQLWQDHESQLLAPLLERLATAETVRLIGPDRASGDDLHRCPTVSFVPLKDDPQAVTQQLVDSGIMTSSGHYYAVRTLEGLDIDPDRGVCRLSFVHYTSNEDIDRLLDALDQII